MVQKWFDRTFDFSFGADQYHPLLVRLENGPGHYARAVASIPEEIVHLKPDGKWSVKEHIGHLLILEPLWLSRLKEISTGAAHMSPADLNNTATDEAFFNDLPLKILTDRFHLARRQTTHFLNGLAPEAFSHSSIHPRLQKPMRIIDLMYFVAEHDDHHLDAIHHIINRNKIIP